TAASVTEISGRGVGLDVVQDVVKSVGGHVRLASPPGSGLTIQMELPVTLSIVRTLGVEIAGEPFAFPLSRVGRVLRVPIGAPTELDDRTVFRHEDEPVALVPASHVLDLPDAETPSGDALCIILLRGESRRYALVVDRFTGEHESIVRPLDPRL